MAAQPAAVALWRSRWRAAYPPAFIKAGETLIPIARIEEVRIPEIEAGVVDVVHSGGRVSQSRGFDAIETVMALKPGALEGRRLRWKSGAWAAHNLLAHPTLQILAWFGFKRAAVALHDATTPMPRDFRVKPVPPTTDTTMAHCDLSRLLRAIAAVPPGVRGDWLLGERFRHPGPLREAAVLVLLRDGPRGPEVLLIKRSDAMRIRPGEAAFPGGAIDATDADAVAAALREAEEEVGLPPSCVEIAGVLDRFEGRIGWAIAPVVGVLRAPFTPRLCAAEVADAAWVPLTALARAPGFKRTDGDLLGETLTRRFPLPTLTAEVWGMTAGILHDLMLRAGLVAPDRYDPPPLTGDHAY